MGTSSSVSGAGAGSPLVPDWVEDVGEEGQKPDDKQEPKPEPVVPPRRLAGSRRALGAFVSTGDSNSMRRGVGDYVRTGRGGATLATRRSAGTARRAATLSGVTGASPAYEAIRATIRESLGSSADANEILGAIAAAASPINGTLDSETGQQSASGALQYVLSRFPNADLLALDGNQRQILLERFLALDCFALFYSETGKHIQDKGDLATLASRIEEIKNYFCETFRVASEERRKKDTVPFGSLTDEQIASECRNIISDAYIIFEAYLDES